MTDETKEAIRTILEKIESASNRATGAALARDMGTITKAAFEIGQLCGEIDELLDE